MAYDESLAARVRARLAGEPAYQEIRMFGGLCFKVRGAMWGGVLGDDRAYWKRGSKEVPFARTDVKGLEKVFAQFKNDTSVVVLIKIDREAKFANMVDVIDGLDLARLTRFSLDKLSDEEKKEVEVL